MKIISTLFVSLTLLLATGCYLEADDPAMTQDLATEDVASSAATLNTTPEAAPKADVFELQMSVDENALDGDEYETEGLCDSVGQTCSTTANCGILERCIRGKCACECDFGAFCNRNSQCGFAGFCQNGRCNCF